jgi:ribosomal protein L29
MAKKTEAKVKLGASELRTRELELSKKLVTTRLSLDAEGLQAEGGIAGLRRQLQQVRRDLSVTAAKKGK